MTDVSTDRTDAALDRDDDMHVHCCHDSSILLCGLSGDNPHASPDRDVTCVVCAELEFTPFCPRGFDCEEGGA